MKGGGREGYSDVAAVRLVIILEFSQKALHRTVVKV